MGYFSENFNIPIAISAIPLKCTYYMWISHILSLDLLNLDHLAYISLQCELTPINLWWNALIYSSFHFDALCFYLYMKKSFLKNLNVLLSHFVSRSQKFKLPCLQLSPMYAYADSFYFCSNVLFCFFALTRI